MSGEKVKRNSWETRKEVNYLVEKKGERRPGCQIVKRWKQDRNWKQPYGFDEVVFRRSRQLSNMEPDVKAKISFSGIEVREGIILS